MNPQEARLTAIEGRLNLIEQKIGLAPAAKPAHFAPAPPPAAPRPAAAQVPLGAPAMTWAELPDPPPPKPSTSHDDSVDARSIDEIIGGKVLPWMGGGALLIALGFLIAWAHNNGFLGPSAIFFIEAAASAILFVVGCAARGRSLAAGRMIQGAAILGAGFTLISGVGFLDVIPYWAATLCLAGLGAAALAYSAMDEFRPFYWLGAIIAFTSSLFASSIEASPLTQLTVAAVLFAAAAAGSAVAAASQKWRADLAGAGAIMLLAFWILIPALIAKAGFGRFDGLMTSPSLALGLAAAVALGFWLGGLAQCGEWAENDWAQPVTAAIVAILMALTVLRLELDLTAWGATAAVGLAAIAASFTAPHSTTKSRQMAIGLGIIAWIAPFAITNALLGPVLVLVAAGAAAFALWRRSEFASLFAAATLAVAMGGNALIGNGGSAEYTYTLRLSKDWELGATWATLSAVSIFCLYGCLLGRQNWARAAAKLTGGFALAYCCHALNQTALAAAPKPMATVVSILVLAFIYLAIEATSEDWIAGAFALIAAVVSSFESWDGFAAKAIEAVPQSFALILVALLAALSIARHKSASASFVLALSIVGWGIALRLGYIGSAIVPGAEGWGFGLTVASALYGLAAFSAGWLPHASTLRWVGYGCLLITACKAMLIDLASLGEVPRIIGFAGLGLCLIGAGWMAVKMLQSGESANKAKEA